MTSIFQASLKDGVIEPHITSHRKRQAESMPIFHGPIPMAVGGTHWLMQACDIHYYPSHSLALALSLSLSLSLSLYRR